MPPDAGLGSRKDGAQHLVIATYDLLVAAQELSKHRSASGLSSLAIPAEAIWDEFGEGLATPQAVRAFLEHAKANYKPAPSYVALAGKGTYDERNLLGFNDNLIPTWFRKSVWGVVGMDSPYVEGLGMKLGRIPATTGADLLYFVQKTAAHEAAPVSGRVTLLSDNKDAAGDFPNDVLDLASAVPATYTTTVSRLGVQSLAVVRQAAISAFQRGDDVVGWVGHGGTDRFATEGVLVLNDVPALNNAGHLSLLVGATCNVNGFYLAGNGSLGEKLVNRRDGGAIASWAPVGPSYNAASVPVVRTLLPELLSESSEGARLGDVLQKTQELQGGEAATERSLWQLLGDPGALVP